MTITCVDCDQPLYPHLACITSLGWRHVQCLPVEETCAGCQHPMISEWFWRKLDDTERHIALSQGKRRKSGPGQCSKCANAAYRTRLRKQREQEKADRLEDIIFMSEHGESLVGAARRLDLTRSAIEHFLVRYDRRDVLAMLTSRNPVDHNKQTGGTAVVRAPRRDRDRVAA